ncbi:2Fe-2S iron-sulfur cluster-binding protein [Streptomyces sp. NPDC004610]|uniref:2Fe-2S iron-sulfur cluster-binding protein n=1 Tax=unclassified Streptomyces TaxID=2593676 RepID=UPI00339E03A3
MTDDQHGEGTPQGGGRWDPLPQGEYDDGATAFVKLPEGGIDALMASADSPLAAPGHGYVPPAITVTPAAPAATDPSATGTWTTLPAAPADATQWQSAGDDTGTGHQGPGQGPGQAQAQYGAAPGDGFAYHPGATGQWNFGEAVSAQASAAAPGHDVTGQWSIPVAGGDLPDESGEFSTSALVEQWGGTPPPTLPGGAAAPWATEGGAGQAWAPESDVPPETPERHYGEPVPHGEPVTSSVSRPRPAGAAGPVEAPEAAGQTEVADAPEVADVPEVSGASVTAGAVAVPGVAERAVEPSAEPDADSGPDSTSEAPEEAAEPAAGAVPDGEEAPAAANPAEPEGDPDTPDAPDTSADPADPPPAPHDDHPVASYVLRVNGTDRPVTGAWIGESLLYVLRERLGLAGAKDGCSQGECGACNVQVDGRLVASCLVPAVTAAGSEVRTVEGLASDGQPSDVQRALARCGAVQCGFCVPGMAMTVHDLLEGNPAPTALETRQALCGNLCRCSGYRAVVDAVQEVVAERSAGSGAESAEHDGSEPRIPHQAGPGSGGVNPSAFDPPRNQGRARDQGHGNGTGTGPGQDGGQA